jgi:hypothetical protein
LYVVANVFAGTTSCLHVGATEFAGTPSCLHVGAIEISGTPSCLQDDTPGFLPIMGYKNQQKQRSRKLQEAFHKRENALTNCEKLFTSVKTLSQIVRSLQRKK